MKATELITSIVSRAKHSREEDVFYPTYNSGKVARIVRKSGWMSVKQFNFLSGISGERLMYWPQEGGYYDYPNSDQIFKFRRSMPNGARAWEYVHILEVRERTRDDYNLSNF